MPKLMPRFQFNIKSQCYFSGTGWYKERPISFGVQPWAHISKSKACEQLPHDSAGD